MSYPVPRVVEYTTADVLGLTVLEWARVSTIARVPRKELGRLARLAVSPDDASPEELETAAEVMYAIALQLERRLDRALTWDDAQGWRVVIRQAPAELALVEAEAEAEVMASMLSGAPIVDRAGELSLAHVNAYGRAHDAARKAARRPRSSSRAG